MVFSLRERQRDRSKPSGNLRSPPPTPRQIPGGYFAAPDHCLPQAYLMGVGSPRPPQLIQWLPRHSPAGKDQGSQSDSCSCQTLIRRHLGEEAGAQCKQRQRPESTAGVTGDPGGSQQAAVVETLTPTEGRTHRRRKLGRAKRTRQPGLVESVLSLQQLRSEESPRCCCGSWPRLGSWSHQASLKGFTRIPQGSCSPLPCVCSVQSPRPAMLPPSCLCTFSGPV